MLRRALFQVHLWTGVAAGLYIFMVCVTGATLVFRIDLQRALYPQLFTASANGPQAHAAVVLESVRRAYLQDRVAGVDAPTTARPTYLAYVTRGQQFLTLLIDPVSARILGVLPERSLIRAVQDLHFDLLGGRSGRVVNGIGAGILLVMCITGLVIWWPGVGNWRRGFTIDLRRSWKRVIWDLHGAVGVWTVMLIAMWALTGISFSFPSQFRSAVNWISPLTVTALPFSNPSGAGVTPRPTWRELIENAQHQVPDQFVARVVVPSSEQAAFLVMFSKMQPTPAGATDLTSVYLDQFTGRLLKEPPRARRTAGDVVMAWVAPLHVGSFGGVGVKLAWLILGLAPPLLFVTGMILWWTRVVRPRWASYRLPKITSVASLVVVLIAPMLAGQRGETQYQWDLPPRVPPPIVPADSPITPARIELGRRLFYDKRLSGNGTQSCATCHVQALAFTDGLAHGVGSTGVSHPRSAMSLINVGYRDALTWANPNLRSLERQALIPMLGITPIELGLAEHEPRVYETLGGDRVYQPLFTQAFPGEKSPVTTLTIATALAAFERSIVSFRSPFDRYRQREEREALSESAIRGSVLFFSNRKARCISCHRGLNLDGGSKDVNSPPNEEQVFQFHNTGLYNLPGLLSYPSDNTGLHAHTGKISDVGKFRVPTLRNIAVTAPYMHDGSIGTLDEVLDHYASGGRTENPNKSTGLKPFALTPEERRDLIAFLESLTDREALTDPRWTDPWK